MIDFHQLHFHYRDAEPVLRGLTFRVEPGEVFGLVGANGAGKSTALACLLGLARPASGAATLAGETFRHAPAATRARLAAVLQDAPLDLSLTLTAHGEWLRPWHPRWNAVRLPHLAARFQLPTDRPLATLSGGQRRLAAVALAMAAEPEALIMDEPAANLDPWSRRKLLEELSALLADRPDMTVLYSTHLLPDLERLGTRVGWLEDGRLAAEVRVEELAALWRHVTLIFDHAVPAGFALPGGLPFDARGAVVSGLARFESEAEREAFLLTTNAARVEASPVSLEEIFLHWRAHAEAVSGSLPPGPAFVPATPSQP